MPLVTKGMMEASTRPAVPADRCRGFRRCLQHQRPLGRRACDHRRTFRPLCGRFRADHDAQTLPHLPA